MKKYFSNQLSKQIGENLLVAKLGELGVVATTLSGNVPDIDVLAYRPDEKSLFGGKYIGEWKNALKESLDINTPGKVSRIISCEYLPLILHSQTHSK